MEFQDHPSVVGSNIGTQSYLTECETMLLAGHQVDDRLGAILVILTQYLPALTT